MAANAYTLGSLIFKMGFDTSGLMPGTYAAKAQLDSIAASAKAAQAAANGAMRAVPGNAAGVRAGQFVAPGNIAAQYTQAEMAAMRFVSAQDKVRGASERLGGSLGALKAILASFALVALTGFAIGIVQTATEFQKQMVLIKTQARASTTELENMKAAVLSMAAGVQTGPEELAKGLYHIESVGLRGAQALEVLKVSAEGARVGNANLESVTNAMVAAVTSGVKGVDSMTEAMGTLNGIVGSGNMRMQDLTDSLRSGILASATTFGISLQSIGAALAAMTDQGIPATEAATRLRIAIALIGAPTHAAAEQLSRIGLSSRQLADDMRGPDGLIGAMKDLSSHLKSSGLDATEQAALLKNAFGGSRSSSGILTIVNSIDLMDAKMAIITDTSKHFGETFAEQSDTAAAKFAEMGATIGVLEVNLSKVVLGPLTSLAKILAVVATQTGLLTAIFIPLIIAVGSMAVIATGRFILRLGALIIEMTLGRLASLAMSGSFYALTFSQSLAAASAGQMTVAIGGLNGALALLAVTLLPIVALVGVAAAVFGFATDQQNKHADAVMSDTKALLENTKTTLAQLQAEKAKLEAELKDASNLFSPNQPMIGPLNLLGSGGLDLGGVKDKYQKSIDALDAKIQYQMLALGRNADGSFINGIDDGMAGVIDATLTLSKQFGTALDSVDDAAKLAGGKAMEDMAQEIRAAQNAPLDALRTLHDLASAALLPTVEIARLVGEMASQELASGLASQDAAVYAQAVATKKLITERLDELTNGAYSAGANFTGNLAEGLADGKAKQAVADSLAALGGPIAKFMDAMSGSKVASGLLTAITNQISAAAHNSAVMANDWQTKFKPSAEAVASALSGINLATSSTALSDMSSAFNSVKSAANSYFDEMHRRTNQAIDDALKQKNAILDAKKALIQGPVTAAQSALDFQRQKIEEWRLRSAVSSATDPASYRDAVLALQDFLAQQHINTMKDEADAQSKQLDSAKAANDAAAAAAKAASDEKLRREKADLEQQLQTLQTYLAKHPGEWQSVETKILALLAGYGMDYKTAGAALGDYFVQGLRSNIEAAEQAAKDLAGAMITPAVPSFPGKTADDLGVIKPSGLPTSSDTGSISTYPRPIPSALGDFRVLKDNLLYLLHQDEMVAPADVAGLLRAIGSPSTRQSGVSSGGWGTVAMGAESGLGRSSGSDRSRPAFERLIVQVGDQTLAEIVDRQLAQQDDAYGRAGTVTLRASR